ncbi:hypothetical protein CNECB9_4260014 [Cupriavidus necator]|uniref:Extra-cytoplasmic solute receptor n=1 Tax=Cupriavidus necator TaxID=106590 RepID=A0A1K0IKU1_CUPNE|nr:hypothetical protein CNECB9_4260014 [Cupriavidus necator]
MKPVSLLAEQPFIWIANNKFPASTVLEWISLAKARPKKIVFAHNGVASFTNLGAEMFMQLTGSEMLAVPYKVNATPDLLSGVVDMKMEPASTAIPLIKSGMVKALAVTSATRMPSLPDVPAMAEFFPGFVVTGNYSVWVPAGTPPKIVESLNSELVKIVKQKEFQNRVGEISIRTIGSTPEVLWAETRKESAAWERLIKERNIKVE